MICPVYPRCQQPSDSPLVPELPLAKDISRSVLARRRGTPSVHSRKTNVHSRPTTVHLGKPEVHRKFRFSASAGRLILFDDKGHFRARGHTVSNELFVLGPHLVLFEGRIAGGVDGEQFRINGVTLRVADASGLFKTNLHKVSFDCCRKHPAGWIDRSIESRRLRGQGRPSDSRYVGSGPGWIGARSPRMRYWCAALRSVEAAVPAGPGRRAQDPNSTPMST